MLPVTSTESLVTGSADSHSAKGVTVVFAICLVSEEPSALLCVSVGGGVGGAAPTTGARQFSTPFTALLEGWGEDLCELGGVVDVAAWARGAPEGGTTPPINFSMATICLP